MITTPAKKTEHHFKLLSFPVGGSLQRAEMGHFRKAPKINARIVDLTKWNKIAATNPHPSFQELRSAGTYVELGDIAPHTAVQRGTIPLVGKSANFNIFFNARNGFWTQELRLRLVEGQWLTATRVTKDADKGKPPKKLYERIDKGYPRNSKGEADWSEN